jgi:hypothetical protein
MLSRCCKFETIPESGFNVCMNCGRLGNQSLDTSNVVYGDISCRIMKPYSRKSRFEKKVLGLLRCLVNYRIDEDLLFFLQHRKIQNPADLHREIGLYSTKGRRPFDNIMYYWVALGFKQPTCTTKDILFLKQDFDNIFFAWDKYGYSNPKFPYSYLFRKIVMSNQTRYSKCMQQMTDFVRRLKCTKRKKRYDKIFKACITFNYLKEMRDDKKIDDNEVLVQSTGSGEKPKPSSAGQVIYAREKITRPISISPYDVKHVYKTQREVDAAIANGTFNVAKTMHMDKHGRMFFLSMN